jgi:hypothetical protein
MKAKLLMLITVIAFLVIWMGCSQDSPTSPKSSGPLWPLKVGNFWSYTETTSNNYYKQTREVTETSGAAYTCKYTNYWRSGIGSGYSGGYYEAENRADGYYEDGEFQFKYPAKAGDKYQSGNRSVTVKATDVSVTVPAGTFKSIEYDFGNSTYWVSPGVGLVKQVWGGNESKELQSYTLK